MLFYLLLLSFKFRFSFGGEMNLASSLGIHSFKLIEYLVKIYLFSLKDFTENVLETHTQTGRERKRSTEHKLGVRDFFQVSTWVQEPRT